MRLALTVVSPTARHWADVVVDADPATPVGELAAELDRLAHGGFAGQQPPAGPGHAQVLQFPGPRAPGSLAMAGPGGRLRQAGAGHPAVRGLPARRPPAHARPVTDPGRGGDQPRLARGLPAPEPTGLVEIKVVRRSSGRRGAPAQPG